MKKPIKRGQSPKKVLSPEQRMAIQYGWGGGLSGGLSGAATGAQLGMTIGGPWGAAIGGGLGLLAGGVSGHLNEEKNDKAQLAMQPQFQPQLPQQTNFAAYGGKLNKRGIPNRGTSEQMPYQTQMQSYPNLEFGNGEQMLAMGGSIERRNKNRSREPEDYATFEENFKHMYAQGGRMGAMGPMDMSKIYYYDGGKKVPFKEKDPNFEGPRNSFDVESSFVKGVDPNMNARQKELATRMELKRIMGAQGNASLGVTGDINYNNAPQFMGEENGNPMLRGNSNVGGNIGISGSYNKNNASITGGLGYDPINKNTMGNIAIRKQWGNGGYRNRYNDSYDKSPLQTSTTAGTDGITNSTRYNINDLQTPIVFDLKTGWNPNSENYKNEKITKDLGVRISPTLWENNRASVKGDVRTGWRSDVSDNPAENKFPYTPYADVGLRGKVIGKGRDYSTGATKRELNVGATYDLAHGYNADATFDFFKNKNMDLGAYATGSYNSETKNFTPTAGLRANFKFQRADGGMLNHYNGYKHEDGGIPMGPNAEVEDGETSMKMADGGTKDSTYIFSDQLIVPGKKYTYADGSKKIDSKYGRRTNDKLSDESKKRELNKLMESQEQIRQAKAAQEQAMVENAYQTIAAYGGPINKYPWGGLNTPTLESNTKLPFNSSPFYNVPNSIYNNAPMPHELNFKKSFEVNPADNFKFNTDMPKNAFAKGISQMPSTPNQPAPPYINVPVSGMTSQGSSAIPNIGGGRSTVAPDASVTDEGIRENSMAPTIGYGMQALGLGAEAWRLRGKNTPNKAFTMNRQVLNADEANRQSDLATATANANMQNLGASSGAREAMKGYLLAQTNKMRSKADIAADLQNRQAQMDMTTDQYNAMAGERAYDKNAADKAAQQSAYSKLFSNVGQFGANVAKDYGTRQSENIAAAALGTADFEYKRINGKLVKVPKGTFK